MTDDEIDQACNFLLKGLRDYREISTTLTKVLKGPQYRGLSDRQRKFEKIKLLHRDHPEVISQIFSRENAAWAREPKSDISSFFYKLERRAERLNAYGELTGGNYTAKA